MTDITIGIVTDAHIGKNKNGKLGREAQRLLEKFNRKAQHVKPDLIVDLGDRVNAVGKNKDLARQKIYQALLPADVMLIGNHDVKYTPRDELCRALNIPRGHHSMDRGGWHLVFFNPDHGHGKDAIRIEPEDVEWLKNDLKGTDRATVIFSHIAFDSDCPQLRKEDLPPGAKSSKFGYDVHGPAVRQAVENAECVKLCLAGHNHRSEMRLLGRVPYVTVQALTHEYRPGKPSETHAWLKLRDQGISLDVRGRCEQIYNFQF